MATIKGTAGKNTLPGTALADSIFGFADNDILFGLGGSDLLDAGTGADQMTGGTGNDTYVVDNAGDKVIETAAQGIDTVRSSISLTLGANVENLTLTGRAAINGTLSSTVNSVGNTLIGNAAANILRGGLGHDVVVGGAGGDILLGGSGNDTLLPGAGFGTIDRVSGGAGFDTVDYRDALGGVTVMLTSGNIGGHATGDVITSVASVVGSRFNDILQASTDEHSGAFGGAGHDQIIGSSANFDRLRGDDGSDILTGDNGSSDDFWLQYDRGMDRVLNYRVGADEDHVVIDSAEFNTGTQFGFLNPDEFTTSFDGPVFDNDDRLCFDTSSRILWADRDGSGAGMAVPIAWFKFETELGVTSETPTAANIFVF